jgi:type IV pilus assembly protein PilY1
MVLALTLVAGLTAPFLMLPHAQAATTPLPCTENNANGCTELSPTPPQDTVAVPPNIVLMLDDSGSMTWDIMPDYGYLADTSAAGLVNSDVNGVYYNPTVTYTPPPKADGASFYPDADFSAALITGFDTGSHKVDLSTYRGAYDTYNANYIGTPVPYSISVPKVGATPYKPDSSCPDDTYISGGAEPGYCAFNDRSNPPDVPFNFFATNGYYYVSRCKSISDVYTYARKAKDEYCTPGISFFTATTGPKGSYTRHYVAAKAGDCEAAGLSSDVCDANAATQQNVANWFSYYHTRILMAKSGLMTAFSSLNPKYRFGFGSINNGNTSDLVNSVSKNGVRIAQVAPFGDGSSGTQRANFWKWLVDMVPPQQSTPLRNSLKGAGMYYQSDQPWSSMSSDPGYTTGSTTKFACRASYTILTTDGFWNGGSPSVGNVDGKDGPVYSSPSGKTYDDVKGYVAAAPFSDDQSNTLADVAMYYWANDLSTMLDVVAPSKTDPAFWQHMTTYTMGMGVTPTGIKPSGITIPQIFAWSQTGTPPAGVTASDFSWPNPSGDSLNNIADLAHAAVNGHGNFFSAKDPQQLAAGFAKAIADITARDVTPTPAAVSGSILSVGALTFETGYNTGDWTGAFDAKTLKADGTTDTLLWDAGSDLDLDFHAKATYSNRHVFTVAYDSTKTTPLTSFQFNAANAALLDTTETAGLGSMASWGASDTLANRIGYVLGDDTYEDPTSPKYRVRSSLLGAILRSEPVFVAGATANYYNGWPTFGTFKPHETAPGVTQTYDDFVTQQASNAGMVYVGANDGMLHAFNVSVPTCTGGLDASGNCISYAPVASTDGHEAWAFVPRAVYANLGNLLNPTDFSFRPTVDETPVTRDVFFWQNTAGKNQWHTILVGGVGMGGRGVYALDITDPATLDFNDYPMTKYPASGVLWEFDADMAVDAGCVASYDACKASDLGYTLSKPNIGRLSNGQWVVLVSNGYFPDCSTPDIPTADQAGCEAIAKQAPKDSSGNPYSALFVLDAETGKMIAELKTPTDISGVTSFGLATPVLGDYTTDQVDDVAFAGDAQGNLWRFDLSSTSASDWTVTLVYKGLDDGGKQGVQPITSMPRLFPDPTTNRFIVVFGTGKFLGVGDNSNNTTQALYGVRDVEDTTYDHGDLTEQYLHETTIPDDAKLPDGTDNPLAGASLRCVTGKSSDTCDTNDPDNPATPVNDVPASSGGWFIDLTTSTSDGTVNNAGERVVVNPGAIFASNTVVFETLITGAQSSDPCSPSTMGSILALNATNGGPAGVSSLGGWPIVGGRVNNARTSGSLPVVSGLGGGQAYLPGTALAPKGTSPLSIDAPVWRRRSWNDIHQN